MNDENPVDMETLAALRELGGEEDPHFYGLLLRRFLKEAGMLVENIEDCVGRGDVEGVKRAAHSLKGCAGSVGAVGVSRQCLAIEQILGQEGKMAKEASLWEELKREYGNVRRILEAELGEGKSRTMGTAGTGENLG